MEELYLSLSNFLNFVTEYWPVLILVLISMKWKSYLLRSACISVMLSLVILGKISMLFIFTFWIITWICMWYEGEKRGEV